MDPPKPKLEIEWLYDDHDCELCGPSYAEGAIVRVDNAVVLEMVPTAHCYSSESYESEEVFVTLLEKFGFDVSIRETHVTLPPEQGEVDDEDV